MKTIYKYPVPIQEEFTLELPVDHKILSFQEQNGLLYIWCLVNTDSKVFSPTFYLFGTGQDLSDYSYRIQSYLSFVGTVQLDKGTLVFHLFTHLEN